MTLADELMGRTPRPQAMGRKVFVLPIDKNGLDLLREERRAQSRAKAMEVGRLVRAGMRQVEIARRFGLTKDHVSRLYRASLKQSGIDGQGA